MEYIVAENAAQNLVYDVSDGSELHATVLIIGQKQNLSQVGF